jgi:SAM-dependent methyltransferase
MDLGKLQESWNAFGETDPLWAILADPAKKGGKWDWDEFLRTGESAIENLLRRVAAQGIEIRRGKALDFGCGVGRLTQALGLHFEECVGVDIAPSMIRLAREHNRRGAHCRYELNTHPDLRLFADNTFDFVFSTLVLQHMRPDYAKRYITELIRILAPGGCLVFSLPSQSRTSWGNAGRMLGRLYWWSQDLLAALGVRTSPRFEMHGIPRPAVLNLIARSGGKLSAALADSAAGPAWISYSYFVTKPGETVNAQSDRECDEAARRRFR